MNASSSHSHIGNSFGEPPAKAHASTSTYNKQQRPPSSQQVKQLNPIRSQFFQSPNRSRQPTPIHSSQTAQITTATSQSSPPPPPFMTSPKFSNQPIYSLPVILCSQRSRTGGQSHHSQPLNSVCLDANCLNSNRFLICQTCIETEHTSHERVPLEMLVSDIIELASSTTSNLQQQQKNSSLEIRRQETMKAFDSFKESLFTNLKSIEQEIHSVFDSFNDSRIETCKQTCTKSFQTLQSVQFSSNELDFRDRIANLMKCSQDLCTINAFSGIQATTSSPTTITADSKIKSIETIIQTMAKSIEELFSQKTKIISSLKSPTPSINLAASAIATTYQFKKPYININTSNNNNNNMISNMSSAQNPTTQYTPYLSTYNSTLTSPTNIAQVNLLSVSEENHSNLRNTIYDSAATGNTLSPLKSFQQQRSISERTLYNSSSNSNRNPHHLQLSPSTSTLNLAIPSITNMPSPAGTGLISRKGSEYPLADNQSQICSANVTAVTASVGPAMSQRFEFSKTMKDPNIILSQHNRQIVNGKNEKLHYRVQVMQPDLEGVTPTVKTWSMRITKQLPHWIGFGMCHVNEIRKTNYRFTNSNEFSFTHEEGVKRNEEHGCYFVTTHGWAFAHKQKLRRSHLRFSQEDIVTCKFDPMKKCLIFTKNNDSSNSFIIDFEPECWNKLHPCVIMWYPGDSIELL